MMKGPHAPNLLCPPEREAEVLPAPDGAGLERGGGVEVLADPSEPDGLGPSLRAGLRKRKDKWLRKSNRKKNLAKKRQAGK